MAPNSSVLSLSGVWTGFNLNQMKVTRRAASPDRQSIMDSSEEGMFFSSFLVSKKPYETRKYTKYDMKHFERALQSRALPLQFFFQRYPMWPLIKHDIKNRNKNLKTGGSVTSSHLRIALHTRSPRRGHLRSCGSSLALRPDPMIWWSECDLLMNTNGWLSDDFMRIW